MLCDPVNSGVIINDRVDHLFESPSEKTILAAWTAFVRRARARRSRARTRVLPAVTPPITS